MKSALNDFGRKSGFLFLAINAGSAIQFLFQAVMARQLTDLRQA